MAAAAPWMFLQVSAFAGDPQTLRLWDFVLLSKTALSERSEFAVFESAFSKTRETRFASFSSYRGSRQGLVRARTLARCSRKFQSLRVSRPPKPRPSGGTSTARRQPLDRPFIKKGEFICFQN